MKELILKIIPHPTCKTGYSIQHNRYIGWRGCTQNHIGWFRTRKEAEARKTLLLNWNDMFYTESILENNGNAEAEPADMILF